MKMDVINLLGSKVSEVTLTPDVFAVDIREDLLARVVKWQLAKRREGNHKAKTRAEVKHTTRKPFKQKGTGRARQGMTSVSQMRGGGVVFGPVVRDHSHSLPKKVRARGLKCAISAKVKDGSLIVIDSLALNDCKTSNIISFVKNNDIKSALFVSAGKEDNFSKAIANVVNLDFIPTVGLNVYDILNHSNLIITVDGINSLMERLNANK